MMMAVLGVRGGMEDGARSGMGEGEGEGEGGGDHDDDEEGGNCGRIGVSEVGLGEAAACRFKDTPGGPRALGIRGRP